ncbi:MAG: TonB-dependent receptor [Balneolales bacterium]|nr:TonB-dependent receptor [Balneolales bacterium]
MKKVLIPLISYLALPFLLHGWQSAYATTEERIEISGQIVDELGSPLAGALIRTKDGRWGTVASAKGEFRFFVTPGEGIETTTLIVRFIGYKTQETDVKHSESTNLSLVLTADPLQRDFVVITASPAGGNRSYQPGAAISLEGLNQRGAENLGEALYMQPGLNFRNFGSAPSRPVIRGFDGNRVLVLENGERMGDLGETAADHAISMDMEAADRIEIVRGPASFLYGSGAIGGVVNLFNSDTPSEWSNGLSGRVALSGMTVNDGASGFSRLTYGTDNTAISARFAYRNTGNFSTPDGILPDTFNESLNGALGMSFRNDGFTGGLSISGLDQVYGLPEEITDPDERVEIRMNRLNMGGFGTIRTDGFFDEAQIRFNISRYGHKEVEVETNEDGSIDEDIEIEFRTLTLSGTALFIKGSGGTSGMSSALGASSLIRMFNVGGEEGLTPDARNLNLALFGYTELPLSEFVNLQTGLRGDFSYLEAYANSRFDAPEDPTRSSLAISGSAGLNFRPNSWFEGGFQLARAFRTPTVEELFTDAAHIGAGAYEIGDPNLDNEISWGADIFTKMGSSAFGAELNAFYYYIQNFIYFQPTGRTDQASGLPIFEVQSDDAHYYGFEADLVWLPVSSLQLRSGFDAVWAERLDDNSPLPFIPPLRIRNEATFRISGFTIGAENIYTFEQNRVTENEESTEAFSLINLFGTYSLDASGRHTFAIRADNLLNERYRNHLSRVDGQAFRYPMPGRGFTVRYQYIF